MNLKILANVELFVGEEKEAEVSVVTSDPWTMVMGPASGTAMVVSASWRYALNSSTSREEGTGHGWGCVGLVGDFTVGTPMEERMRIWTLSLRITSLRGGGGEEPPTIRKSWMDRLPTEQWSSRSEKRNVKNMNPLSLVLKCMKIRN